MFEGRLAGSLTRAARSEGQRWAGYDPVICRAFQKLLLRIQPGRDSCADHLSSCLPAIERAARDSPRSRDPVRPGVGAPIPQLAQACLGNPDTGCLGVVSAFEGFQKSQYTPARSITIPPLVFVEQGGIGAWVIG